MGDGNFFSRFKDAELHKVQADILDYGVMATSRRALGLYTFICSALEAHVACVRRAPTNVRSVQRLSERRAPGNTFRETAFVEARLAAQRVSRNCARGLRRALIGPPLCARASKRAAEDFFLVRGFPGKAVPVTRNGYVLNHMLFALKSAAKQSSCLAHGVLEY